MFFLKKETVHNFICLDEKELMTNISYSEVFYLKLVKLTK